MSLIADFLLAAGALGAGLYCLILSRRLSRFTDLEKGVGGAVAVLSVQVDDLTKALERAQRTSADTAAQLEETTVRAEKTARDLELQMASSHGTPRQAFGAADGRAVRRNRRPDRATDASEDAA